MSLSVDISQYEIPEEPSERNGSLKESEFAGKSCRANTKNNFLDDQVWTEIFPTVTDLPKLPTFYSPAVVADVSKSFKQVKVAIPHC